MSADFRPRSFDALLPDFMERVRRLQLGDDVLDERVTRLKRFKAWLDVAKGHTVFLDVARKRFVGVIHDSEKDPGFLFDVPLRALATGHDFCTNFENVRPLTPLEVIALAADGVE